MTKHIVDEKFHELIDFFINYNDYILLDELNKLFFYDLEKRNNFLLDICQKITYSEI